MQIQKVFQAGNSQVVAIPKAIARELGLRVGHKVMVEKLPDDTGLVIKRADQGISKKAKTKTDKEFQSWLAMMLEEDGELIKELAKR